MYVHILQIYIVFLLCSTYLIVVATLLWVSSIGLMRVISFWETGVEMNQPKFLFYEMFFFFIGDDVYTGDLCCSHNYIMCNMRSA